MATLIDSLLIVGAAFMMGYFWAQLARDFENRMKNGPE